MPAALRKVILSLIVSLTLLLSPAAVFAQTPNATSTASENIVNIDPSTLSQTSPYYANIVVINLIHTLSCLAEGRSIIGQPCISNLTASNNPSSPPTFQAQMQSGGGLMGGIGNTLTLLYTTKPLSTREYLASAGKNLGIISPAYAQVNGSGNAVLSPIFKLWEIARNISYMALILIFVVIGVMIMLRSKINPQTVISVQKALPGLVVGLILITFSYFISALIVDLTFVTTQLGAYTLQTNGVLASGSAPKLIAEGNIFNLFDNFISLDDKLDQISQSIEEPLSFFRTGKAGQIITAVAALLGCQLGANVASIGAGSIASTIGLGAIGCVGGAAGAALLVQTPALDWAAVLIIYVILVIALAIAMFRVAFALIQSYVTIIILTISAPFWFLIASIPGREKGVGDWVKEMVANLLCFPAVFLGLIFAAYILGTPNVDDVLQTTRDGINTGFGASLPLLGGLRSDFLKLILGYGVLLMLPNIPEFVKNSLGVKDSPFGKAAIGNLMAGVPVVQKGYSGLTSRFKEAKTAHDDAKNKYQVSGGAGITPKTKWL